MHPARKRGLDLFKTQLSDYLIIYLFHSVVISSLDLKASVLGTQWKVSWGKMYAKSEEQTNTNSTVCLQLLCFLTWILTLGNPKTYSRLTFIRIMLT